MAGEKMDFTRRQALAVASGVAVIPLDGVAVIPLDQATAAPADTQYGSTQVPTIAAKNRVDLAAITPRESGQTAFLAEPGREGVFMFERADVSPRVALDRLQGIYIAPAGGPTGASGAWVRRFDGPVELRWFGVSEWATDNAARLESAIRLITTPSSGGEFRLPPGRLPFERTVSIMRACMIRGHGSTAEGPGTVCTFPAGSSGFVASWDRTSQNDAFDLKLIDLRLEQPAARSTTATVKFDAGTGTATITGGTNDFSNGQIVWIEGASIDHRLRGRTATTASGSNAVSWDPAAGHPGIHVGQHIDIEGARLPLGTVVRSVRPGRLTLSNVAGAAVAGAAVTVRYPLVTRVVSGGGSSTLVLDQRNDSQSVTGAAIRHADAGVDAMRPVQLENVDAVGFAIGIYAGGESALGAISNTSQIRFCRISSSLAGIAFVGWDGNANNVWGCDFSFCPTYGVLDLSAIENKIFGGHWAFGIGVASPRAGNSTALFGLYHEDGTAFVGSGSGSSAFGCRGIWNRYGWAATETSGAGWIVPSLQVHGPQGALSAAEHHATTAYFTDGVRVVGPRGASLPADATDLATVIRLANAIKSRLRASGGHGLVAD